MLAAGLFGQACTRQLPARRGPGLRLCRVCSCPTPRPCSARPRLRKEVEKILHEHPGREDVSSVIGYSMLSGVNTTYSSFFFVSLQGLGRAQDSRGTATTRSRRICSRRCPRSPAGIAFAFPPPAIPGVGTSGGFTFMLEDRSGRASEFLGQELTDFSWPRRSKRPELAGRMTTALLRCPQVYVNVDQDKVLPGRAADVYQTLQTFMGGSLVNYFNRSAASGRSTFRRRAIIELRRENLGNSM